MLRIEIEYPKGSFPEKLEISWVEEDVPEPSAVSVLVGHFLSLRPSGHMGQWAMTDAVRYRSADGSE